ncbi:hypothetical protein [Candidatus Ruminimicrobiellum ovillum]|uniref:hypothetical protein n=1 Tax=Candidatus Ruminimicrobiellum ovillum TaxID=1947927 RepID=UPI00355A8AF2
MDKKLILCVGEPWNFKSSNGTNEIEGEVIYEISPTAVIFKSFKNQIFGNREGNLFLCSARYKGDIIVHKHNNTENKYLGTVGVGILKDTNYMNKSYEVLEKNSTYVLIGNFKYI